MVGLSRFDQLRQIGVHGATGKKGTCVGGKRMELEKGGWRGEKTGARMGPGNREHWNQVLAGRFPVA